MHYLQGLVVACLLASGSAHAAHATLSPPPGWSAGGAAAWATPSNSYASQMANQWINNAAKSSAILNAGGKQIAIQASLKLGPSAPKVIAALIFSNPALRTGIGIASWLGTGKVIFDAASGSWQTPDTSYPVSDGYGWWTYNISDLKSDPQQACAVLAGGNAVVSGPFSDGTMGCSRGLPGGFTEWITTMRKSPMNSCPAGWFITPSGCTANTQNRELTQKELVDLLNPENTPGWPMPNSVPNELPVGTRLPVQLPVMNPDTGVNPFPKPMYVPTGDPVANPNYDPSKPMTATNQPYLQPGVKVTPRPTTANPWQVDIQPSDRPQAGPEPLPDTEQETDPQTDDKPRDEDTKSLCEKHPDILACQKLELGDVEPKALAKNTVDLQITKEGGFGPENGTCPAPKEFMVMGKSMAFRWDLLCDFATQIRPLLVGFAYLSAALAFFGLSRKD